MESPEHLQVDRQQKPFYLVPQGKRTDEKQAWNT
jgi:hypothetical protein